MSQVPPQNPQMPPKRGQHAATPSQQQPGPAAGGQGQEAMAPMPQPVPYGQHLLDKGPQGPTKEQVQKKLKPAAFISILYSSIYMAVLFGALGIMILGFITASGAIEIKRDTAGGALIKGSSAAAKQKAREQKEIKEAAEVQFQKDRARLFFVFGASIIALFTGMTTQASGIVAGVNMAKLKSYRWGWRGMAFTMLPICSTMFLVLFFIGADIIPMLLLMAIGFGAADFVRMLIGLFGILSMMGQATRKMFAFRK